MRHLKRPPRARGQILRLTPDPYKGLSAAQVLQRRSAGWSNEDTLPAQRSIGQIIKSNVFTFFNLIFCLLALCVAAVGSWHNLLFMIVVVLNTFIGIVQEIRAKITLDRLTLLSAPAATAVRDGRERTIPVEELVVDDIVVLRAGNQIPADAVLCEGSAEVNESLLTGESDAVLKTAGDSLLSGSFIVSGLCRARLVNVGADNYAARITTEARRHKKARSEMMSSLDRLIHVIGVIIIPFGLLMFFKQLSMRDAGFERAVVSTVAAAVGMIPEGLYLLTSVALAVSVVQLARRKTLVHELHCIETLARVDTLCLDKTGTITEGTMEVESFEALPGCSADAVRKILTAYCAESTDDNMTSRALRGYFLNASSAPGWTAQREIPFSSSRKWGAVDFGAEGCYALGAPEFILRASYAPLKERVETLSAAGKRVLLLACLPAFPTGDAMPVGAEPLALIELTDKIRRSAAETFAFFKSQGVSIKVISGDNPITVREVALRAGVEGAARFVDAQTLDSDEALRLAAEKYTVFGRVTPQQKRALVEALKAQGHTVAMTGDGVNDVLALKGADCSIAMAGGSDAAAHVAQLVLLDSDFASMPRIVAEGRRVINNIERSASLFLVKNIFSSLVALVLLFVALPYPFAPIQLTLISSLTIGIPAFFLALEPSSRRIEGRFMENVLRRAAPGGLTDAVLILGVLFVCTHLGFDLSVTSAACTITAGFTGLAVLFFTCRPFNLIRRTLFAAVAVLFIAALAVTWPLFVSSPMPYAAWLVIAAAVACVFPLILCLTRLVEALFRAVRRLKHERRPPLSFDA